MIGISATIITKNESLHIEECIEALSFVDEIIIVDDWSEDSTVEKAKQLGAKVYKRKLSSFASQRNYAASKAHNNWILSIDADEIIDKDLAREIKSKISDNIKKGYLMTWKNGFMGVMMKSLEEVHLRLYDQRYAKWTGDVHESLVVNGKVGKIDNGYVIHKTNNTMSEFLNKRNKYTSLEVNKLDSIDNFTIVRRLLTHPPRKFLHTYFKQSFYKEGVIGFIWSIYTAIYIIDTYAKVYERINKPNDPK